MYRGIKQILIRNLERNVSIIGFFDNYDIVNVYREGDTLVILGMSDHLWAYVSSINKQELSCLMEKCNIETSYFASLEDWMKPIICKEKEVEWELVTDRYIFPTDKVIEPPSNSVQPLNEPAAEYIYSHSHYSQYTSIQYIKEQMNRDISAGIEKDGKLIAWGLTHDDSALGFLHVLPEYRGRGYGIDITRYLVLQRLQKNKLAFLNVEPDNFKSANLVQKIGFKLDRRTSWVKLK